MDKKEQIEKIVNKFLLSYGEEPNNYNEVFYNKGKNIGINVFMFLCDLAEDLSLPKEVDLDELREEIISDMLGLLSKQYDDEETGIHFKSTMKAYRNKLEQFKQLKK